MAISAAETFWIKQAQAEAFLDGEKEGCLAELNPNKDGDGLLRIYELFAGYSFMLRLP